MKLSEKEIEKILSLVPWYNNGNFDYSKYPLDHPAEEMKSLDNQKFQHAIYLLVQMAAAGRKDAMKLLFLAFEENSADFNRLLLIAEKLEPINDKKYIEFIFNQLEQVKSNNSSRLYLKRLILVLIGYYNDKRVIEGFYRLLENPKFSFRMKRHFKNAISAVMRIDEFSWYD